MKKQIKLTIDMERDFYAHGYKAELRICEMLFTDFDSLFDAKSIVRKAKNAIRKLENKFDMFTITLQAGNELDIYAPIIESFRFVWRYDKLEYSRERNGKYASEPHTETGWRETDIKEVFNRIIELTETGNRKFIELIKAAAA